MLHREIVQLFLLLGGGLTDGRTLAAFSVARLCTHEQSLGVGVGAGFHLGATHPPIHEYRMYFVMHTASAHISARLAPLPPPRWGACLWVSATDLRSQAGLCVPACDG